MHILKMSLVAVTLFPVRFLLACALVPICATYCALVSLGADHSRPYGPVRSALLQPIRLAIRLLLWCYGYWRIPVRHMPGSGGASVLVVAPHYSFLDAIFMTYYELPSAVAKSEVARIPGIGRVARSLQTIFVDRRDKDSKRTATKAIRERTEVAGWPKTLLFPEGTCTNGRALITFKPGAFSVGKPVQPVLLHYGRYPIDVNANGPLSGYLPLFLAMLQPANSLSVTYLPVVYPSEAERADPYLFGNNVRQTMAAALGVPTTAHSYDDVWLQATARKFGIEQTFEVSAVRSLFNLDVSDIASLLSTFHSVDRSGEGLLSEADFRRALGLENVDGRYARRLFQFFNVEGTGAISFAEVVQGLALLSPECSVEDKMKLAFLMADLDATGGVSKASLGQLLDLVVAHEGAGTGAGEQDGESNVAGTSVAVTPPATIPTEVVGTKEASVALAPGERKTTSPASASVPESTFTPASLSEVASSAALVSPNLLPDGGEGSPKASVVPSAELSKATLRRRPSMVLKQFDTDGDELLSYAEFCEFLASHTEVLEASMQSARQRLLISGADSLADKCARIKTERKEQRRAATDAAR